MTAEMFGTSGMDGMGIDSLETKKIHLAKWKVIEV